MATKVTTTENFTEPIVRRKQLSAHNEATMRTVIETEYGDIVTDEPDAHGGTGTGPSPLQTVLGALCGLRVGHVPADRRRARLRLQGHPLRCVVLDRHPRAHGCRGCSTALPVKVQATVRTGETPQRLAEVVKLTESRCPVYNLITDAGFRVEMLWVRDDS